MKQSSGDNSQNFQVSGDFSIGISASEARQIAIDVFKANYYEFSEKAAKKALERAEEITNNFIDQFYKRIPELEKKLEEPSIQSSIYNVQKEYAKTGQADLENQLLELLIERINSPEESLKRIVLDEALLILPKLTKDQINFLTLIVSLININQPDIVNMAAFEDFVKKKIVAFYPDNLKSFSFFRHLQFTGCCSILGEGSSYKPLEEILKNRYKAIFSKGFSTDDYNKEFDEYDRDLLKTLIMKCLRNPSLLQFNPLNDQVFDYEIKNQVLKQVGSKAKQFQDRHLLNENEIKNFLTSIDPKMKEILESWKTKDFKTINLTSVGMAIGIMNYNKQTGENVKFSDFF